MDTLIARGATALDGVRHRPGVRLTGLAVLATMLLGVLMSLGASSARADDNDYSMYKLSSSVATFYGNSMAPDDNAQDLNESWLKVSNSAASGGAMLGYPDPDISDGLLKWASSSLSGSSGTIGYNMFKNAKGENGEESSSGVEQYAYYGATLKGLGLDSTSGAFSGSMFKMLGGGIIFVLFVGTAAVDMLFHWAISVLDFFNPFKLFFAGVQAINPELANAMTGGKGIDGPLGGLANWIGGWYSVLVNLSWAVMVPIFFAFLVFGLILFRSMDRGGKIKKFVVRLLFLGLGLPLLGGLYTSTLTAMSDMTQGGASGSSQVVLSTYVDFENWAKTNRLAIPNDCKATIEWDTGSDQPSAESVANVRNTALCINSSVPGYGGLSQTISLSGDNSWANQIMQNQDDTGSSAPGGPTAPGGNEGSVANLINVWGLLGRYMGNDVVSASDFETSIKSNLGRMASTSDERKDNIGKWFTEYADSNKLDGQNGATNPMIANTKGGLQAKNDGNAIVYSTDSKNTSTGLGFMVLDYQGKPIDQNLSPLAMYNYLNTSFGPSGLVTYSSEKATSGAVRESHNSVSQVGTGAMSFLYWLNSAVLLSSFVIIGLGYALMLIFASLKRSIQLVTAIPFATIGAIPGIAKVIIYAFALVLEVVVTAFLYVLVQNILISLPQIIEMPLSGLLGNKDVSTGAMLLFLQNRGAISMIITVVSIVTIVWFTILAMRIRKTVLKGIEEAVTKIVDRFLDTSIAPPSRGMGNFGSGIKNAAGAAAAGIGGGAGMAAMNNVMGRMGGEKSPGAKTPGTGSTGPQGASLGGMPGGGGPGGGMGSAGGLLPGGMGTLGALGMGPGAPGGTGGPDGGPQDGPDGGAGGDGVDLGSTIASAGEQQQIEGPNSDREIAAGVEARGGLQGSGDALDSMSNTADHALEGYKAKDLKGLEQAGEAGKGVVKAGEAVGRGFAGDAPGAVSAGLGALQAGQNVQAMEGEKKDIQAGIDGKTPDGSTLQSPGGTASLGRGGQSVDMGSAADALKGGQGGAQDLPKGSSLPAAGAGADAGSAGKLPSAPAGATKGAESLAGGSGSKAALAGAAAGAVAGGTTKGGATKGAPTRQGETSSAVAGAGRQQTGRRAAPQSSSGAPQQARTQSASPAQTGRRRADAQRPAQPRQVAQRQAPQAPARPAQPQAASVPRPAQRPAQPQPRRAPQQGAQQDRHVVDADLRRIGRLNAQAAQQRQVAETRRREAERRLRAERARRDKKR